MCLPHWTTNNQFLWFSIDNIDFLEATPSGTNTLHGTVTAMFQNQALDKSQVSSTLKLDRSIKRNIEYSEIPMLNCRYAERNKGKFNLKLSTTKSIMEDRMETDLTWIVGGIFQQTL